MWLASKILGFFTIHGLAATHYVAKTDTLANWLSSWGQELSNGTPYKYGVPLESSWPQENQLVGRPFCSRDSNTLQPFTGYLQGNRWTQGKTVSVTGNVCAVNRVVTVFCFMVQGMTAGITGNDCWYNRGPTGKQMNTGKNCFSYRQCVCSVICYVVVRNP